MSVDWFCQCAKPGTPFGEMPPGKKKATAKKAGGEDHASGHAITIYGWACEGDSWKENDYAECSWLIQNSWGEKWASGGYGKIKFYSYGIEKSVYIPLVRTDFTKYHSTPALSGLNYFGLFLHQFGFKHVPGSGMQSTMFIKDAKAAVAPSGLFTEWSKINPDLKNYKTVQIAWKTSQIARCSVRTATFTEVPEGQRVASLSVRTCKGDYKIMNPKDFRGFMYAKNGYKLEAPVWKEDAIKEIDMAKHYIGRGHALAG